MTASIYLDHHATTPLDPAVLEAMMPWLTDHFGNPGSVGHEYGNQARAAVEDASERIAACLGVTANEIVFTSGATESNNLAIRGIADRQTNERAHFVSLTTEHKAVLDPLERLQRQGHVVSLLSPAQFDDDNAGLISADEFASAITDKTKLASVMFVNNEMGAIQPVAKIAEKCHERNVLFHCDATQAVGKLPINVADAELDLVSFSGHKIYGPRGIGVLVVRRKRPRIKLASQIDGGGQQQGRRSGTLNVPGIVGLAKAMELCIDNLEKETERIRSLRDDLYKAITSAVDRVELNGPLNPQDRVAGNLNLCFADVDGEALMMNMGAVAVSSGSACTSANPEPSHVLRGLGLSEDKTRSSLRFGIGRYNTKDEILIAAKTVATAVTRLRGLQ